MRKFLKLEKYLNNGFTIASFMLVQFLWWRFSPSEVVPMWVVMILVFVIYIVWVIAYHFGLSGRVNNVQYNLPTIREIVVKNGRIYFIVEPSEIFSANSLVSFYKVDDENGFEQFCGSGEVETVNGKGYFQVVFHEQFADKNVVTEIKKAKAKDLLYFRSVMKVKPGVSKQILEMILDHQLKGDIIDDRREYQQ